MELTINLKILPTADQENTLSKMANEYVLLINDILDYAIATDKRPSLSSSSVKAPLPSAVRNECCRAANSIWTKYLRGKVASLPVLRKPVITWNNQNYRFSEETLSFPVWEQGKSRRITVPAMITEDQLALLSSSSKLGSLRITQKSGKWIAQIAYHADRDESTATGVMGVDLGIKCPVVCACDNGKVRFAGNGRKNKAMRRQTASRRRKLQKQKKISAIRKLDDKESRIMRDVDHKLSREIVDFAIKNSIGTIKLETLQGIRENITTHIKGNSCAARKSRKNNYTKNTWSFYRLSHFIEYKAQLAGIRVEYVNPAYTSQMCPTCSALNHANDRNYHCVCGYHGHRDLVGAKNICIA